MKKLIKDNGAQKWLRKPIYSSKYIYLSNWSFVHFCSGFLLGIIFLSLYPVKYPYVVVFILLVLYEIFEWAFGNFIFYERESRQDRIWDLIIGMLGFCLYAGILNFVL